MTITDAVKKIIELKGLDIFKNLKQFLAFLDDLAPEYQKERKIIKNNFDENILGLFVDESKRPNQRLRWVQIKLDDVGLAKDWADFIIESFGIAFGWENEVQDLKVNAPILNNAPKAIPQQESVNPSVQDVTLNDDVLKQIGYLDKTEILQLDIPSTYKTLIGTTYRIIKIGDEVFKDCDKLQSVTIPDTVKEIGDSAFENCKALEKINIPDSVNNIGKRAFVNCKSLNSITLPNDITEIGDGAFCGCESLITAVIPNKVTKIAEGLFGNCKALVNITIPNGVTEIGDLAFAGCEYLNSVIIPKTVTKIGSKAFANCKSIDSIIIPNTVTDIGAEAFGGSEKLQQFTLPTRFTVFKEDIKKQVEFLTLLEKIQNTTIKSKKQVENIQQQTLTTKPVQIINETEVTLNEDVLKQLGYDVNYENKGKWNQKTYLKKNGQDVTSLDIPATYIYNGKKYKITQIGNIAFWGCSSLITITIPNSVTKIGYSAFNGCSSLENVTIPDSVIKIGKNAFNDIPYIEYYGKATGVPWGAKSWKINSSKYIEVSLNKDVLEQLGYTIDDENKGKGNQKTYLKKDGKDISNLVIPSTYSYDGKNYKISQIANEAFYCFKSLESITIPDSVEKIGDKAFEYCLSLTSITISNNVTQIGKSAFAYCPLLTSITIPNSVEEIGNSAFAYCSLLTSITIPNSVTQIGNSAFAYCQLLKTVVISDSITEIGDSVFAYCLSLTNVTIPNGVKKIGDYAFYYSSLTSIKIPDNVIKIGEGAFAKCPSLTSITIPDSVTEIGNNAFENVQYIEYNGTATGSPWKAKSWKINSNEYIEITLDENVLIQLGYYVNYENKGQWNQNTYLKKNGKDVISLDIPAIYSYGGKDYKITQIYDNAFYNCSSLTNLTIPDSIIKIGNNAFEGIDTIYYNGKATGAPWGANKVINKNYDYIEVKLNETILKQLGYDIKYNNKGKLNQKLDYLKRNGEDVKDLIIPSIYTYNGKDYKITQIGFNTFANASLLENITIPNSITEIGDKAFENIQYIEYNGKATGAPWGAKSWKINSSKYIESKLDKNLSKQLGYLDISDLVIPSTYTYNGKDYKITAIGIESFAYCKSLINVTIPDSVKKIEDKAFYNCSSLKNVTIPNSVTQIGSGTFNECSSLTNVTLPEGITQIENSIFSGCSSLTNIIIPNSVIEIGNYAFYGCSSLTSVKIPYEVKKIGYNSFGYCKSLTIVILPYGISTKDTFSGCLESLKKQELTYIEIILNEEILKQLGYTLEYQKILFIKKLISFKKNGQDVTDLDIPATYNYNSKYYKIIEIGDNLFNSCSSLRDVKMPESITKIGSSAFKDCKYLTSITIYDKIIEIGSNAFSGCELLSSNIISSLKSVIIPKSVAKIGDGAFRKVPNIDYHGIATGAPWGAKSINYTEVTLDENVLKQLGYKKNGQDVTTFSIPSNYKYFGKDYKITKIGKNAFSDCSSLKEIMIPDSITEIGEMAFCNCRNLTNIRIPDSVTQIGDSAFCNCWNLTNITIPNSVKKIGRYAFAGCWGLKDVIIPKSVTEIGDRAFYDCNHMYGLRNVTIPKSVTRIGEKVFSGHKKEEEERKRQNQRGFWLEGENPFYKNW